MLNADLTKKAEHYKHNSLLSSIKKGKEVVMFGDIEIEKKKKKITVITQQTFILMKTS